MIHQRFKIFTKLLLIISVNFILAQKQDQYNIVGNVVLDDDIYIQCIQKSSSSKWLSLGDEIKKSLNKVGYYNFIINNFSVDSTSSNEVRKFYLDIDEGKQSIVRSITTNFSSENDSLEINKYFQYMIGEPFIESELERNISLIISDFENKGYPFTSVTLNSVTFENDSNRSDVFLTINVNKDEIRRIDKVEITGNSKTRESVIINASRLRRGELYSQKRVEEIPVLLNKLRFFKNVATPEFYIDSNNEGILKLSVEEKSTNSFDGILGYVPARNSGESGYLTGFANISLRNLFGTGRALSFKWNQESSVTQEIQIKYLEPWVFSEPFNLNLHFFQRKQDSTYVKRIIGADIEYLATENVSASIILESESIIPSLSSAGERILNSSSFNSGIELKLDYRDNILAPTNGILFISRYKYQNKNISGNDFIPSNINSDEINYHNYELDFNFYYSTFSNQVIALGIKAKEIVGDYFDISDYFQLGGTNTLRGYRENQFLGNRIMWSNLEYRFLLSLNSFVFGFYDIGYFLISKNEAFNLPRQSDLLNGYGLGISLETGLGIMRVSYAFGEGSSISEGLIHFGLINDF